MTESAENAAPRGRGGTIESLRRRIARIEGRPRGRDGRFTLGVEEIDRALPGGGLSRRGVHVLRGAAGDAARFGLAAVLAARLAGRSGTALWCRPAGRRGAGPYGPGLAAFGLGPANLLVASLSPRAMAEAVEEALASGALAVVVAEGLRPDALAARRLALAAERGRTPALLLPPEVAEAAFPATSRWTVAACPGAPEEGVPGRPRWRLALERCRGALPRAWIVEWDDAALRLRLVSALADRPLAAAARG